MFARYASNKYLVHTTLIYIARFIRSFANVMKLIVMILIFFFFFLLFNLYFTICQAGHLINFSNLITKWYVDGYSQQDTILEFDYYGVNEISKCFV